MPLNIQDLKISSPDIEPLSKIDPKYVADGGNVIPRLHLEGIPAEAVELVIIVHDPDAPLPQGFTHLTAYGIKPEAQMVDFEAARSGPHGGGAPGYTGPEPPFGHGIHHYYFWVYAVNRKVEGTPTREEFLATFADSIVEQNRFVALYER